MPKTRAGVVVVLCLLAAARPGSGAEPDATDPLAELEAKLAERRQRAIELAELYEGNGEWRPAAAHYETARRIRDDDTHVLNALARLYRSHNDDAKLLSVYTALARLQPTSMWCLRELGSCYFRLGQREEAEKAWRKILEAQPSRSYALRHLGQIYTSHKLLDQAVAAYREALVLSPKDEDIRLHLAEALGYAGDQVAALAAVSGLGVGRATVRTSRAQRVKFTAFLELRLPRTVRAAVERRLAEGECSPADLAWAIARAFEESGDRKEAAAHFRRVATEEPNTPRGKEAAQKSRKPDSGPSR